MSAGMRLGVLQERQSWWRRLKLQMIAKLFGIVPGPVAVLSYRRELLGKPFVACLQQGMRGAKEWHKEELELFAAFISKLNACAY